MTPKEKEKMFREMCERIYRRVEAELAPKFHEMAHELAESQLECERLRRELDAANSNLSPAIH